MKKLLLLLLSASVLYACNNSKKDENKEVVTTPPTASVDSTLVTDSTWGPIGRNTDLAGLETIYGKSNIKDAWICGPECADTILVTKIYPDSLNEITVYWQDSAFHKKIMMLEVFRDGNPYHTAQGIRSGSTLNDILKLNGQKISFSGFSWDYGGMIQSFHNGNLEKSPISYRLEYRGNAMDLDGDIELNTDMPHVKKALDSIHNYYLSLSFQKE